MVFAVKVSLQDAEKAKQDLLSRDLIDFSYLPKAEDGYFYIAVLESSIAGYDVVEAALNAKLETTTDLREALTDKLSREELDRLKTAYDLVGDIAVLEIDEELRRKETLIGETLLAIQPAVAVVVRKAGGHEGELRLQDYVWLAGEKRFETTAVENGVRLTLDIRKAYYSVRSSTERQRVASLVKPGERVLCMFSGIGPFVCVIAKNTEASEVIGVELNADAHLYAEKNIAQNKLGNACVVQGDVREIVPTLGTFDRIPMPLPHTAHDFLDVAVAASNPGATIHLYHFSSEEEVTACAQTLPARLTELGRSGKVVHIQKCGNLGPGIHRWSIDIQVE